MRNRIFKYITIKNIYFIFLTYSIISISSVSLKVLEKINELPIACDPFGYLEMAREFREYFNGGSSPKFIIEHPQSVLVTEKFRSTKISHRDWYMAVAPQAYRYFDISQKTGVQYQPGTGLILGLFPEGKSIRILNRIIIGVLTGAALIGIFYSWRKSKIFSAILIAFSFLAFMVYLIILSGFSFSFNVLLIPLFFSVLTAYFSLRTNGKEKLPLLLASGILFGFSIYTRAATLFLFPGFLILIYLYGLDQREKIFTILSSITIFSLGVLVTGIIPLAIHQEIISGAWYLSTYPYHDTEFPMISEIPEILSGNIAYYYQNDRNSVIAFFIFTVFFICFLASNVIQILNRPKIEERKFANLSFQKIIALILFCLIPEIYFLTHKVHESHYLYASRLATIEFLALISLGWNFQGEILKSAGAGFHRKNIFRLIINAVLLFFIFSSSYFFLKTEILKNLQPKSETTGKKNPAFSAVSIPEELKRNSSWVIGHIYTGTFYYYTGKPAFKMGFTTKELRKEFYNFVRARNDELYIIEDDQGTTGIIKEYSLSAKEMSLRGTVFGSSYYKVIW
ncbi:MAG: glucosyltransferase domain-containing protein [Leptospira sp.]|nr:glucosyltransferase domain-containing protein [Leptospira sp.]